jgi:hypothetical protein
VKRENVVATIGLGVLLSVAIFAGFMVPTPRVLAQNNGTTGTFTVSQTAFTAASSASNSKIFQNIGQSAHYLAYCNTGFNGTLQLQESFDGKTNWTPMSTASYLIGADTGCHLLQAGGYFQNVRAAITVYASGTLSAWYNASSGPIAYAAASVGTKGPAAPIGCDQSGITTLATGEHVELRGNPVVVVCAWSVSFDGTPAAGSVSAQASTNNAGCSGTPLFLWQVDTTASTPQVLPLQSGGAGGLFRTDLSNGAGANICLHNDSGATATFSYSYAQPTL